LWLGFEFWSGHEITLKCSAFYLAERYFEEGNKMVKRTLIAIAVVALLASGSQAALQVYTNDGGLDGGFGKGAIKTEGTDSVMWPWQYKSLDLCSIPITMKIGYYVAVHECHKRKIELVQVDCADLEKGSGWPCYQDCESVTIKSNFEVKLGLSLRNKSGIIDKWAAYIKGDVSVIGPGSDTITVCVEAWKAKLAHSDATAGSKVKVGDLVITVKPNV
jgi:hypothetical protein